MNLGKYNKAAYRKEVWKEAARLLRESCFPEQGDGLVIPCDFAFRAPKEVPPEIIQEILVALHAAEIQEDRAMQRYQLEEMEDERIPELPAPEEESRKPATKAGRGRPSRGNR